MIAAANDLNAGAVEAGGASVFDFPAIVAGINFDMLARAYPRCIVTRS